MRRIFWGFWRNLFLIDPLHYLSNRSDFGFKFVEIFIIEKRLSKSGSWRLSDLVSWGVVKSRFFECLKENSTSLRVWDSPTWGFVFRLQISPFKIQSQNRNGSKGSVMDLWGTNFCKNPRKVAMVIWGVPILIFKKFFITLNS